MFEAKILSWEWALKSMNSLHMEKVTFAASTMNIIKAIHKPTEWPLILSHIAPLLVLGSGKQDWFVLFEPTKCNTGAFFIAKSVTLDLRLSSYVARHAPRWLAGFFEHEKSLLLNPSI